MDETFINAFSGKSQQCPSRKQWVSFRLVDELGKGEPYAGLAFEVTERTGEVHVGTLDECGFGRIESTYCGPLILSLTSTYSGADKYYKWLANRKYFALPITALQVAAEQTQRRPSDQPSPAVTLAVREKGKFYRVEVCDFVEATRHLPPASTILAPRPSASLAANVRQGPNVPSFGVALAPDTHHVFEVKALRAWRPLLSLTPEFSALDAYQLSLFTVLAYADFGQKYLEGQTSQPTYPVPGTVGHVLNTCLANIQTGGLVEEPGRFADAKDFHPLLEEVPYSKRLEVVPFDPQLYTKEAERNPPWELHSLDHQETNTQAYITHDDRMVLIGVRGTQENPPDLLRDMDAAQVPYAEGVGQAHQGFYQAFQAVKAFVAPYLFNFHSGQKIVVCGHSLGGAIALLLAEWIRRDERLQAEVLLYTYGAPRAGDKSFAEGAAELLHHRLVNHNDPIPSVPDTWMDTDKRLWVPGLAALVAGATGFGGAAFLAGLVNFEDDPYQHHGIQHHFLPLPLGNGEQTSVLWQPHCAGFEDAGCAYYAAKASEADMADRAAFLKQLASISEHSTVSGYVPACHATLLRWQASCETSGGSRLTAREQQWLNTEIESYQRNLEDWERQARHIHQSGTSSPGKRQALGRAIARANQERNRLPNTLGRIQELAQQQVTRAQVYGAAATQPNLDLLVAHWQSHPENHPSKTPRLARVPKSTQASPA